jgi:hypothetical protein
MPFSIQTSIVLLIGVVGGALTVLAARAARSSARYVLAAVLIVAAAIYVVFATRAENMGRSLWVAIELAGVGIYGAMALAGVRGSAWWLVAGWALHPVWDIGLHEVGAGRAFAPRTYVLLCLSFDLAVAAIVALAIVRDARWMSPPRRDGRA